MSEVSRLLSKIADGDSHATNQLLLLPLFAYLRFVRSMTFAAQADSPLPTRRYVWRRAHGNDTSRRRVSREPDIQLRDGQSRIRVVLRMTNSFPGLMNRIFLAPGLGRTTSSRVGSSLVPAG
jgi:hypothetical protein